MNMLRSYKKLHFYSTFTRAIILWLLTFKNDVSSSEYLDQFC